MANYEKRYVAFLDVLGFREAVRKSLASDETLIGIINALHSITPLPSELYPLHRNPPDAPKFGASVFSDSIIIFDEFSIEGIIRILTNITRVTEGLAMYGLLARGSLTCGYLHAAISPSNVPVIFGPALVQAVDLEKVARFPRVILSAEAYHQIYAYGPAFPEDYRDAVIVRDEEDGAAYISPMYGFRFFVERDEPDLVEQGLSYLVPVGQALIENLKHAIDNPEHFKKQRWFIEWYNSLMVVARRPELQINVFTGTYLGRVTENDE